MVRFLVLLLALVPGLAMAQTPPSLSTQGTVDAVLMDRLQLKADDGTSKIVVLPPNVIVVKRVKVGWMDIKQGDWVGIDSKPGADGNQQSVAINIFSPAILAKVRKGHFPMESGDLMTNAPVDHVTMSDQGNSLTLKDADAMVAFQIGPETTVHRMVDADASAIKSKAKIQVRGTANADGSIQAVFVSIVE